MWAACALSENEDLAHIETTCVADAPLHMTTINSGQKTHQRESTPLADYLAACRFDRTSSQCPATLATEWKTGHGLGDRDEVWWDVVQAIGHATQKFHS